MAFLHATIIVHSADLCVGQECGNWRNSEEECHWHPKSHIIEGGTIVESVQRMSLPYATNPFKFQTKPCVPTRDKTTGLHFACVWAHNDISLSLFWERIIQLVLSRLKQIRRGIARPCRQFGLFAPRLYRLQVVSPRLYSCTPMPAIWAVRSTAVPSTGRQPEALHLHAHAGNLGCSLHGCAAYRPAGRQSEALTSETKPVNCI
jgi:hypothetical protein